MCVSVHLYGRLINSQLSEFIREFVFMRTYHLELHVHLSILRFSSCGLALDFEENVLIVKILAVAITSKLLILTLLSSMLSLAAVEHHKYLF